MRLHFAVSPRAAALVVLLVSLAFAGSARPARAAEPMGAAAAGCASAFAGTDAVHGLTYNHGVRQPFDLPVAASACTLGLDYAWAYGQAQVRVWNPLTLAPDGRYVALRSRAYDSSQLAFNHLRMDFSPPLVTAAVPHVAQPMPTSLVFDYLLTSSSTTQNARYWSDGPVGMPAAFAYDANASAPLPGAHPVLAFGTCPPSGADADLRVLQSVVRADALPGLYFHDYIQKFRVPQRCELHAVELPLGINVGANVPLGRVAVFDAAGAPEPPAAIPPVTLAQADFLAYHSAMAGWETHYPFASYPILEPDHDYWLWAYTGYGYNISLMYRDGSESAEFQDAIGPGYTRVGPYQAWDPWGGIVMNFRLVGVPLAPSVSVPPAATVRGLHLSVEPNPARSAALVRWVGAAGGGAHFEVLDPRGRRVARHDGAGDAGTWLWRGAGDAGEPLPAGVYFVRAVDREGHAGSTRVVLMR